MYKRGLGSRRLRAGRRISIRRPEEVDTNSALLRASLPLTARRRRVAPMATPGRRSAGRVLLVPESSLGDAFFGWLDVRGCRLPFRVVGLSGEHPRMRHAKLQCSNELRRLLRASFETVRSVMRQSRTLDAFVDELDAIVRRLLATPGAAEAAGLPDLAPRPVPSPFVSSATSPGSSTGVAGASGANTNLFARIADELAQVGWTNVANVDDSFRNLELICTDKTGRKHTIQVIVPADYPESPPECVLNVPVAARGAETGKDSSRQQSGGTQFPLERGFQAAWDEAGRRSLQDVVEQAAVKLDHFVGFWAEMEDFDANTWVLEPARPSRSDVVRRIALRKHCSIEIALKPDNPRDVCTCNFIGPENITGSLRNTFHAGQKTWDASVPVRMNLERILGQPFPSPSTSSKSDFSIECGVCYSYRIMAGGTVDSGDASGQQEAGSGAGTLLPDVSCESCGQHFHAQCIGEWLQALPTSRRSFNVIFGNCPYCTAPISVNLLES